MSTLATGGRAGGRSGPTAFDVEVLDEGEMPERAARLLAGELARMPRGAAASHRAFREWAASDDGPEYGKWAYIDGKVVVDVSPEYIGSHTGLKGEVFGVLRSIGREAGLGEAMCDGVLVSNPVAGVSNEPDVVFVTWESVRAGRVRLTPGRRRPKDSKELVGSPDIVVEVVSDGSVQKDEVRLRAAYYAAGIPEYWLMDGRDEEKLRFDLLRRGDAGYEPAEVADGWVVSAVLGRRFRLERGLGPGGWWSYALRHEPIAAPDGEGER